MKTGKKNTNYPDITKMKWNRIGFGTWPLSGDNNGIRAYGKTNDEDSIKALIKAYENGINVFDTSDFYGFGHVESLLGNTFYNVRDKICIITKGGMISNEGKQNFSISHLSKSMEASLDRLKTNYVDVYMLHSPELTELNDGKIINMLSEFKKSGVIREYGISLRSPQDGFQAILTHGFKIIEVNYNLLDIRAEQSGLFDVCKSHNVKVVCRTPLAQGILSGKFQFNDDASDKRQQWSLDTVNHQTILYKKILENLKKNPYTIAQNCLRFCLANDIISVIIPGMKTDNEVIENIQSLSAKKLTVTELKKLKEAYTKYLIP